MDAPEMLAVCEELNLASVNRSPLARGALSGKYARDTVFPQNDVRTDSWSRERFFDTTLGQLDAIREILTSNGRTLCGARWLGSGPKGKGD
jgi:aryl-alcohol dehydrogenase-like predicted oxidoreductase